MPNLKKQTALAVLLEFFIVIALLGLLVFVYKQHKDTFRRIFFWKKAARMQNDGLATDMEKGRGRMDENTRYVPGLRSVNVQNWAKEAYDANAADSSWSEIIQDFPRPPKAALFKDRERESPLPSPSTNLGEYFVHNYSPDISQASNTCVQESTVTSISNINNPVIISSAPGSTSSQPSATHLAPELPILPTEENKNHQTAHIGPNTEGPNEEFAYL